MFGTADHSTEQGPKTACCDDALNSATCPWQLSSRLSFDGSSTPLTSHTVVMLARLHLRRSPPNDQRPSMFQLVLRKRPQEVHPIPTTLRGYGIALQECRGRLLPGVSGVTTACLMFSFYAVHPSQDDQDVRCATTEPSTGQAVEKMARSTASKEQSEAASIGTTTTTVSAANRCLSPPLADAAARSSRRLTYSHRNGTSPDVISSEQEGARVSVFGHRLVACFKGMVQMCFPLLQCRTFVGGLRSI